MALKPDELDDRDAWITYARQLEQWANSMPDAGLTVDDPRYSWWVERPCAPFRNNNSDSTIQ